MLEIDPISKEYEITPNTIKIELSIIYKVVRAAISPYPTVVKVAIEKYTPAK